MRDMSKFGRVVSKVSRKAIAIALAFAMSMPGAIYADEVGTANPAPASEVEVDSMGRVLKYFVSPEEHYQDIVDEAKALGVPDAFIKHYFANEYEQDKISKIDEMKTVKNTVGTKGLVLKKISLVKLAQTKIDLGEFNFGDYKAGNMVYSILSSKKVKGTAYFYVDNETEPFYSARIRGSIDDPWGVPQSFAADVRKLDLKKQAHFYLKFVADEVLDSEGKINTEAEGKGSLYLESLFFTEGSTPVLSFDIDKEVNSVAEINGSVIHNTLGYGVMNVQVPEGYISPISKEELTDKTYELDYIKGRGNSTWRQSKKPYKIKLDKKDTLLGMPANKHWGLLANYFDYTLLRNRYTDYLAEQLKMPYTPRSVAVDVVMDGVFYGSYQLSETIRIDDNRIAIDEVKKNATTEPDITGGYLLQHNASWLSGEKLPRVGDGDTKLVVEKPEYDEDSNPEAKKAQLDYIGKYLGTIDKAVDNAGNIDKSSDSDGSYAVGNVDDGEGEGEEDENIPNWRDVLDEDSLINYTLMQSFSLNNDSYSGSTYYYKPKNDKLYCGPVWDFDFVAWGAYLPNFENQAASDIAYAGSEYGNEFGIAEADGEESAEENEVGSGLQGFGNAMFAPWFLSLYSNDKEFKDNVVKRWNEFSAILKESAKEGGILDQMAKETYMSALANYQVASSYLIDGQSYWGFGEIPMVSDNCEKYTLNYFNEINRLKHFVNSRASWVDENITEMDSFIGGIKFRDRKAKFYVDDELYAEYDINKDGFVEEEVADAPEKEGYIFKGWFYIDDDGEEIKYNPSEEQYTLIPGTDDNSPGVIVGKSYYAKYVSVSDLVDIESFKFVRDTVYVPMYKHEDENDYAVGNVEGDLDESSYSSVILDLKQLIRVLPFDANMEEMEFCEVDKNGKELKLDFEFDNSEELFDGTSNCGYVEPNGYLNITDLGEIYIKAKFKDKSAVIKVVGIDMDDEAVPTKLTADKEVKLKVGDYGDVNFKYDVEDKIAYYMYPSVRFTALDDGIVELGTFGSFRAVKPGETTIASLIEIEEKMLVALTKVTVVDPNAKPEEKAKAPKKGKKITDKKFIYKITKKASDNGKKAGEVVVVKLLNKKLTKATVKTVVKIDGYKYKVTAIGKKAFKGAKKLKKVTIGKNVKKIGAKAFYNLKKLTNVTFKSKKLPKLGKKAFYKKGKKKITIKFDKKLKKKTKKALKKSLKKALKKAKCKGVKVK